MIDEPLHCTAPYDNKALTLFYCQGGFDFDRLGTLDKLAMRAFFHMLEGRGDAARATPLSSKPCAPASTPAAARTTSR